MQEEIIFNIDVMLAKRKMSVTELADKVGITIYTGYVKSYCIKTKGYTHIDIHR